MSFFVYIHTNLANGKVYVGKTIRVHPELRWGKNGEGYKCNEHFWRAIQKYGWEEGFSHEYWEVESKEIMDSEEKRLIKALNAQDPAKGYNHAAGGDGGFGMTGKRHTEESNEKNRQAHLGANNVRYGKKHSAATIQKMREAKLGKHHSEETKEKIRQVHLGKSSWNKGKHLSDASKEKLRQYQKGRKLAIGTDGKPHWYTQEEINMYGLQLVVGANTGKKLIVCPDGKRRFLTPEQIEDMNNSEK